MKDTITNSNLSDIMLANNENVREYTDCYLSKSSNISKETLLISNIHFNNLTMENFDMDIESENLYFNEGIFKESCFQGDLKEVEFKDIKFRNLDFRIDLSDAKFIRCKFYGKCQFNYGKMNDVMFDDCDFYEPIFSLFDEGKDTENSDWLISFYDSRFYGGEFKNYEIRGGSIKNCKFNNVEFFNTWIYEMNFDKVNFDSCVFNEDTLFYNCDMKKVFFSKPYFENAIIRSGCYEEVNINRPILSGLFFTNGSYEKISAFEGIKIDNNSIKLPLIENTTFKFEEFCPHE